MPTTNVQKLVQQTQSVIAMVLYFAGMALSVFASAGLVAAVFEPGASNCCCRSRYRARICLLGRYAGNVLVVAANILYLVLGSWIIFGIKTGVWGHGISAVQPFHDLHLRGAAGGDRAGRACFGTARRSRSW